jgi:nucleoside-diphosphate-sugar epimerase
VRGVVRSDAKGKYLQGLFPGKPVEYVVVPDMNEDGAYDSAVAGIDGVVHAASPLNAAHAGDPQEVIGPAVAGVTGILGSLTKAGHKGRIVTISSVAAIASVGLSGPVRFTDEDWNEESVKRCTELGAQATGVEKYAASKVYAERAFWKFFNDNKGQKFDGTAINPGYVSDRAEQSGRMQVTILTSVDLRPAHSVHRQRERRRGQQR